MLLVFLPAISSARAADDWVWWEGETPLRTNFPAGSWFSASTFPKRAQRLSGRRWLSNDGKRTGAEAFATYRVTVPADGPYAFWTRKFWKHGPFRWRFDGRPWQTCGRDVALADSTPLKKHTVANWVHLGKVTLTRGPHTFELRLLAKPGESKTAAFDCFLLTQRPFTPAGKLKPGQKSGKADEGYFAWEPTVDSFEPCAIDLRRLNETVAGEGGFIRRKGDGFVLAGGKAVRFWGVNVNANNAGQSRRSVDYLARKLAKLGVNMVRYHSPMFSAGGDPANVDPKKLDNLHYLVAAMKKQGIYTKLSFYFPLWFDIKPGYGIAGYDTIANKKPFALLYFDKRMQAIHRAWAEQILTAKNPYTGVPLAKEPALAIVEIVNEDSFFFWTFSKKNIPAVHWRALEGRYNLWLGKRYPNRDMALRRLYEAWHMTAAGMKNAPAEKRARVADQVRFLADLQHDFYENTRRYLRTDLGYGGLVSASNWKTADGVMTDSIERWTYTACDVIDRHGYFGGKHTGEGASYSVRPGHTFASRSGMTAPEQLMLQVNQVVGRPHIISEIGWPNPNRYRSECTFLGSAYASLQGVDGLFWFAVGHNALTDRSMKKFAVSCPAVAGAFPAMALQYRRGDVMTADAVVHDQLKLSDLFALKGHAAAAQAMDALRKKDAPKTARPQAAGSVDPLAYYAGGVFRSYSTDKGASMRADLSKHIRRDRKTVSSVTGQLAWDYGKGTVTVRTPRSCGAAGFLSKTAATDFGDVIIECKNDYATITVISLDGKPLAQSRKILIQAMTGEQPYGFKTAGNRIVDTGTAPFGIEKIRAVVSLKLTGGGKPVAVALDENGYPTDKPVKAGPAAADRFRITLAPDAVYHLVTR